MVSYLTTDLFGASRLQYVPYFAVMRMSESYFKVMLVTDDSGKKKCSQRV